MNKFAKMVCLWALCSGFALGCGSDDDGSDDGNGNGEKAEGCVFTDDDTCQESVGISAACGALGGSKGACSKDKVLGTCVYGEDGPSTTIYYYEGDTWSSDDPKDNCDSYDGTYTKK